MLNKENDYEFMPGPSNMREELRARRRNRKDRHISTLMIFILAFGILLIIASIYFHIPISDLPTNLG